MSDLPSDGRVETTGGGSAAAMAIMLWLLVAGGLAYGIVSTLQKVVDLFGG
jgi:hypothetical protein